MVDTAINFVNALYLVYSLLILAYILLSWIQLPYNLWLGRIRTFLHDTVEPYLRLFRRLLPPVGGFDFTPIVALFALFLLQRVIIGILVSFD
jgi:YggT family protein